MVRNAWEKAGTCSSHVSLGRRPSCRRTRGVPVPLDSYQSLPPGTSTKPVVGPAAAVGTTANRARRAGSATRETSGEGCGVAMEHLRRDPDPISGPGERDRRPILRAFVHETPVNWTVWAY